MQRVCMNFSTKCNMCCDFCYNYFDGAEFQPEVCLQVIDRCLELGAEVFSIGGGDPFHHKEIWTVLEYLRSKKVFVHIDTNGLALDKDKLQRLNPLVDLLALPLDGSNRRTHEAIRKHPFHFAKVTELLEELSAGNYNYRVKINTIAARTNISELMNIGSFLEQYNIDIWSIYEFWPLHKAAGVIQKYQPDKDLTDRIFQELGQLQFMNHMYLEISRYLERYRTYFFITPQGIAYVNDNDNPKEYRVIGDIFDYSTAVELYNGDIGTIREGLKERFKRNILYHNKEGCKDERDHIILGTL